MTTTTSLKRTAAAVGVAALLAPAGVIAVADAASTKTVKLKGQQFSPTKVSIKKGDKIKFVWAGGGHNLRGPGINVPVRSSGSKVRTFKKRGTFTYVCDVHPGMQTKIKVS